HTRPLHSRPHALIYLASNLTHRHPWPVPHSPIHPSIPRWQRRVSPSGTSPLLDQRGFHALSATNPPLSTAAEPRHRRCSTCPAARRVHRLRDPAHRHHPRPLPGPRRRGLPHHLRDHHEPRRHRTEGQGHHPHRSGGTTPAAGHARRVGYPPSALRRGGQEARRGVGLPGHLLHLPWFLG